MQTITHSSAKTFSRILVLQMQIRHLLRRTSQVSEEQLSAIELGIERRWIRDVNIYAVNEESLCQAQLVLRIDWDNYNVMRFVEKSYFSLDDNESPEIKKNLQIATEIDEIIQVFSEFVSSKSLSTKWGIRFQPDVTDEQITSLGMSYFKPIKWESKKYNSEHVPELPEINVGIYLVDKGGS